MMPESDPSCWFPGLELEKGICWEWGLFGRPFIEKEVPCKEDELDGCEIEKDEGHAEI